MSILKHTILNYSRLRSALFSTEALILPLLETLHTGRVPPLPTDDWQFFLALRADLDQLFQRDAENIAKDIYPVSVLRPEPPRKHLRRLPLMFFDGLRVLSRRQQKDSKSFKGAEIDPSEVPEYYQRNFHFQTDGYLSEKSAELYDHQVELLFSGAADPMRRLLLPPLREAFKKDGAGLKILELGAGTGSFTRFLKLALPKAQVTALDLSAAYLKFARKRLSALDRLDFIQGAAEDLPFKEGQFDAVVSVFLFHELPAEIRTRVIQESLRVLKPKGFLGYVDSIQWHDWPLGQKALEVFPIRFHEPFFKNYIHNPMSELVGKIAGREVKEQRGFFSKAGWLV